MCGVGNNIKTKDNVVYSVYSHNSRHINDKKGLPSSVTSRCLASSSFTVNQACSTAHIINSKIVCTLMGRLDSDELLQYMRAEWATFDCQAGIDATERFTVIRCFCDEICVSKHCKQ